MESGINADQNFYSRRPPPPSSTSPEPHHQLHHHYESPPLPEFEARSPQLPPKLPFLTTQNLRAATANGFLGGGAVTGRSDPDDFYREYRGVQQSANGYTEGTANGMPTAAVDSRQFPSSLRSNGNGSTLKHPPLPAARANLKPSYRSASSPLEERTPLGSAKSTPALNGISKPSVKDLLRRFDQNNGQPSSTPRKPAPRLVTKDINGSYVRERAGSQTRGGPSAQSASGPAATSMKEAGPSRVKTPQTTRTQRTRFAAEDQHSNNILSSAPRAPRARNAVAGSISQASKSMTNLSPTSPNAPANSLARKPLFGEVLPNAEGAPSFAYGIPPSTGRRTSDSSLHPTWAHQRGLAEHDIDPSSPTAWYLGLTPRLDDVARGHNRSHSDFADSKTNNINRIMPTFNTTAPTPTSSHQPLPHTGSRLPIATSRYSGSSDSSSMPSTRGNSRASSPNAAKARSSGRYAKLDQRPWSPTGRSVTPTNRSRTPTRGHRGSVRTPERPHIEPGRLNAIITAPPPKLSPPLRSSRPRLPVSSATTASSRQRAVERSGSPGPARTGIKVTRGPGTEKPKSRKVPDKPSESVIDTGPVDFAARRLMIQRAYTKSIHRSAQQEIRAANLRRLQERSAGRSSASPDNNGETVGVKQASDLADETTHKNPASLHVDTTFSRPGNKSTSNGIVENQDSPTLGIPGSFVDDEEPASAISNATGVTDIDNEPQTEAPLSKRVIPYQRSNPALLSSQILFAEDQFSPEQAMFGVAHVDDQESINIILDATPVRSPETHRKLDTDALDLSRDPSPPGAFREDSFYERNQLNSPSPSTPASPKGHTPIDSRAETPSDQDYLNGAAGDISPNGNVPHQGGEFSAQPSSLSYQGESNISGRLDSVEASNLQLPTFHTTPAPRLLTMNDIVHETLHTPVTDIEYESSDGFGGANASEQESFDLLHSRGDLHVPSASHRSSQLSSWTDDSVHEYSGQEDAAPALLAAASSERESEMKPTPPPKESPMALSPTVPPKPDGYSPQLSPITSTSHSQLSNHISHQLPPISTGEDFGVDLSSRSPKFSPGKPLWPEYAPPSIPLAPRESSPVQSNRSPQPSFYSRRPPSSLYQSSHNENGRIHESRRTSDDAYSPRASESTPRSSTQISLEDVTTAHATEAKKSLLSKEEEEVEKKKEKNLRQRCNVIKELIDTEAIYLKDMNVVEEIYRGTAEACPKLDTNDIATIFRNTAQVVAFSTMFLDELKAAGSSVYSPRGKTRPGRAPTINSGATGRTSPASEDRFSSAATLSEETAEQKDRKTFVGAQFGKHLKQMQDVYTDFLKNSELASSRLIALQTDAAVKVWLSECNLVAKDLTAAWDLDALLVKPVQRITRYQLLLAQLVDATPDDHPDYQALQHTSRELAALLKDIDDLKKRIHMVGKIVGRKRKESDVRTGIAKAFGRRADKLQSSANRPPDDEVYVKLHDKFGDDYLRLQVVLRDVEFYTRQCSIYVSDFLRYLSAMELIMRMSASPYPELESKWARFNMSMRDMGTVALEDHINAVRQKVIEPFEQVIQAYGPPGLAMKKRSKRRLDYEKSLGMKPSAKDAKLIELVDQYEALNETLKIELPKLSSLTETIGKIALVQFVRIQTQWYQIWQEKVRVVLEESQMPKDIQDIISMFSRDYKFVEARAQELGIVNGTFDSGNKARGSQSTQDDESVKAKGRPSNLTTRSRGVSITSDQSPSLPTPDFVKRNSGSQFTFSPIVPNGPGLPPTHQYQNLSSVHSALGSSSSAATAEAASTSRSYGVGTGRPSTSRSYTSDNGVPRLSTDFTSFHRRESGSTYNSTSQHQDGPPSATRPFSGLFNSALPDGPEDSQRGSRTSSRDRSIGNRFNVLYLAASLFEFNISATKSEAGYPYLTYQAGEIFDVIGEKGELWLAKNQDDLREVVGWIWSKHFARLATD